MDDIFIEIPDLRNRADSLKTLSQSTYKVAEKMTVILQQLGSVWQDEAFSTYSDDVRILIRKLLEMQETANKMSQICQEACDAYQKAEDEILKLI